MDDMEIKLADELYPELLGEIRGAPRQLYARGDIDLLKLPMMAVVGSRRMSRTGESRTRLVVEELVKEGYVVVSGLAKGIDKVAHETTLDAGGRTVAVLAHGLDIVYPAEHTALAERIVESGGLLVSELPVGVKPEAKYFLERNRIIVGMSRGLVVIEAQLRSGSLASANHAAEMGRTVLAVPGSAGTDLLILDGAQMLDVV